MTDADRRVGFVDVLAAGATGFEGLDAQVFGSNRHLVQVLQHGNHVHAREGGVAAVAGVERRESDEPVYAPLGLEVAVGVAARGTQRGVLDTGFFAVRHVNDVGRESTRIGPTGVHAQQHLGPVLGFGTAGAGLDGQEGVMFVVLVTQQQLKLKRGQTVFQGADFARDFLQEVGIVGVKKVKQADHVVRFGIQLIPKDDFVLDPAVAPHDIAGAVGVVPEAGSGDLAVEFG